MRIIKINEQQYSRLLLNEELHYPKFLDVLKDTVSAKAHIEIERQIACGNVEFEFSLPLNCEYTDNIILKVSIDKEGDISDKKQYRCFYYNEYNSLIDDKLINPQIIVRCPSRNGRIMFPLLKVALSHEITHLYDDWSELKRNGRGINYFRKNGDTTNFVSSSFQMNDNLYKSMSIMAYMSLKVERQAFLSQTVQELEYLGCTLSNYKQKLKETTMYGNITKSYRLLSEEIRKVDDYTLRNCNTYIISTHPKANMPKMNIGNFNAETYRKKISSWAEKVYHETMKSYASVVQYYINRLKEINEGLNDLYIL